ncbi:hypothetical protein K435DRAFT_698310 [Dendrothele bispora CBS 962.96]|uniref:Uncharacterized protein n=1 Tax=Dendrothele bispora (strain CBS 962.96) TaxID=1314807 RepID=A0A4S8KTQ8_DENBC|nr:hypothetical protein K435DRAFT_698310 [Dendrothele bispora CBS 962.96]
MNPPLQLPDSFDLIQYDLNELRSKGIPARSLDSTPEKFFDSPFTSAEVELAKAEIGKLHPGRSASGEDGVHYADIREMDTNCIVRLINESLDSIDKPSVLIIATLFITLLFLTRMVNWAESRHLIPPSQNGFRKGFRTNNNAYVLLSAAIEKAKSMGKTLWVASVDISNAFPSVHRATLWVKLQRLGAGGKIFDWLRMIYCAMLYKVRHGNSVSRESSH